MARIARVVAGGIPHHIIQRGNRRQLTFFCEDGNREYISLMAKWCFEFAIEVWAYCLIANHLIRAGRYGIRNQAPKAKRKNNSVWCFPRSARKAMVDVLVKE